MKRGALFLPLVLLGGGCEKEEHDCADAATNYYVEMTRPLVVDEAPLDTFTVEAAGLTATSDASGKVPFPERSSPGPTDATIDRKSQTIRVSFWVEPRDGRPTDLAFRVKRDGLILIDEKATVEWGSDGCNLAPVKSSI